MGSSGGDRSTTTNAPPQFLTDFMGYLQNTVQPLVGTGGLNPRIPDGFQLSAPLDPSVTNASNGINNYLGGQQYQNAQNNMFSGLQNLQQGNVPGNPLSQSGGTNQQTMEQTLYQLMTGGIPGQLNTQGGQSGPGFIPRPISTGNIGFSGGGWSSGPQGGYNPLTNSDIQGEIDASNDDMARALERAGLADTRREAIKDGGLGGSRQGIAEGVQREGLGRAMLTNAANLRNQADNNERNRLASMANANISAGASAGASNAATQAQLQIAQMGNQLDWGRLLSGNALGAANANQGLMNSGYGYGIDALRNSLALGPSIMQSPLQNYMQQAGLGMQLTDFNQSGIDRNLAGYMQNNSTLLNDLQSYAGLFYGSNPSSFGSQTTQGPSSSRFGNAMGGAASGYSMSGGQAWGSTLGFMAGLFG